MVHVLTPDWGQINIQYSDTDWTVQQSESETSSWVSEPEGGELDTN